MQSWGNEYVYMYMYVEGNGTPLQYSCLEKSHGWRSRVGCSPWGLGELDTTEQLHFHFSLSCIEEGNGNSLQCSCLENPRDGGAWWAAVYGVAQSRTWLKRLSSSKLFYLENTYAFVLGLQTSHLSMTEFVLQSVDNLKISSKSFALTKCLISS